MSKRKRRPGGGARKRPSSRSTRSGRMLAGEMAPNLPDSGDDRPQPGRLSEATLDQLRPEVAAWTMLTAYLSLVRDAGTLDPAADVPEPAADATDADRQQLADIARLLRQTHPMMVAGYARDAQEIMTWIRPRWRATVIQLIVGEAHAWLHASGYRPDQATWLAGARSYLRAMTPAAHVEQGLHLLDAHALQGEYERVRELPRGRQATALTLDDVEHTVWYALAMRAHPVAAIHAAAALAAWLWAEPGAVTEPGEVAVQLAGRALRFAELAPPVPPTAAGAVPADSDGDQFVPDWEGPAPPFDPATTVGPLVAALDANDDDAYCDLIAEIGSAGSTAMAAVITTWASYVCCAMSGSEFRTRLDAADREARWAMSLAEIIDAEPLEVALRTAYRAVQDLPDQPDLWALLHYLSLALHEVVTACGGQRGMAQAEDLHIPPDSGADTPMPPELATHATFVVAAAAAGHPDTARALLDRAILLHGPAAAWRLAVGWSFIAAALKRSAAPQGFAIHQIGPPAARRDRPSAAADQRIRDALTEIVTVIRDDLRNAGDAFGRHRAALEAYGPANIAWILAASIADHVRPATPPEKPPAPAPG